MALQAPLLLFFALTRCSRSKFQQSTEVRSNPHKLVLFWAVPQGLDLSLESSDLPMTILQHMLGLFSNFSPHSPWDFSDIFGKKNHRLDQVFLEQKNGSRFFLVALKRDEVMKSWFRRTLFRQVSMSESSYQSAKELATSRQVWCCDVPCDPVMSWLGNGWLNKYPPGNEQYPLPAGIFVEDVLFFFLQGGGL